MTINEKLLITPKEQSLLDKLLTLSHLRPDNSVTPLVTEYYDLSGHYKVGDDIILQYMRYKLTTPDKPASFVKWFTGSEYFKKPVSWHDRDVYQHQLGTPSVELVQEDLHHRAQENKLKRYSHGSDVFP